MPDLNFVITRVAVIEPLGHVPFQTTFAIQGPEVWRSKNGLPPLAPRLERQRSSVIGPSSKVWILCATGCRYHACRARLIRRQSIFMFSLSTERLEQKGVKLTYNTGACPRYISATYHCSPGYLSDRSLRVSTTGRRPSALYTTTPHTRRLDLWNSRSLREAGYRLTWTTLTKHRNRLVAPIGRG
jgi:hypothetical protein